MGKCTSRHLFRSGGLCTANNACAKGSKIVGEKTLGAQTYLSISVLRFLAWHDSGKRCEIISVNVDLVIRFRKFFSVNGVLDSPRIRIGFQFWFKTERRETTLVNKPAHSKTLFKNIFQN